MRFQARLTVMILLTLLSPQAMAQDKPDPYALLDQMEQGWAKVKDFTAVFTKQEIFGKKLGTQEVSNIKFRKKPFSVYFGFVSPVKGKEALYVEGTNDNEVKAHPGKFPDVTVNLDPKGSLAMTDQHHPILHAGFGTFVKLMKKYAAQNKKTNECTVEFMGVENVDGRPSQRVEMKCPKVCNWTKAKKDETLWTIADRMTSDMYLILHNNSKIDGPDDVDEGQSVCVPRYYASRAILWLDKEWGLPTKAEMYDYQKNLYERFEYSKLKINVGLSNKDFDPKSYKF